MKGKNRADSLAKRIVSAILGSDNFTPAQRAKLAEMEKDYEELVHERDARKVERQNSLKQN